MMFNLSASSMYLSNKIQLEKRFQSKNSKQRIQKCAFDIESILKSTNNSSSIDDIEDISSDDGHLNLDTSSSSFCNSSISSYTFVNQLKTNENLILSSSFESEHSIKQAKSKRIRTIFTNEQLERLEKEFEKQQYMIGNERLYLAKILHLNEAQIKIWFQNRRIKWRRQIQDNHCIIEQNSK